MNILVLTWEFYPLFVGGLGRAVRNIVYELYKKGNRVYVVLPGEPGFFFEYTPEIEDMLRGKIGGWKYTSYTVKIEGGKILLGYGNVDKGITQYKDYVVRLADKIDFDVIYAHDWVTIPAAIELKLKTGKPLIVHYHATSYDRTGGNIIKELRDYKLELEGIKWADHVFTVSKREKEILVRYYGADPNKITVVYNGPIGRLVRNIVNVSFKKKYKIVTFVGRLTLSKGPDWFLKAAKIVLDKRKDVLFLVVGGGELYEYLIRLAADLGISRNVVFTGRVSDEELEQIYRISDVVVFPSVSEPFGLVPLEAIERGKPVIVSKQSGVAEVINCLRADFWDTEEFANKILALLEYSVLYETLIANLKKDLLNLSWEKTVEKILNVIKRLVGNHIVQESL